MQGIFSAIILIVALIGWVMNIVKLFGLWSYPADGELIIRAIGIPVFFIGCIAGWF